MNSYRCALFCLFLAPSLAFAQVASQPAACNQLDDLAFVSDDPDEALDFGFSPCLDFNIRMMSIAVERTSTAILDLQSKVDGDLDEDTALEMEELNDRVALGQFSLAIMRIRQALLREQTDVALTLLQKAPKPLPDMVDSNELDSWRMRKDAIVRILNERPEQPVSRAPQQSDQPWLVDRRIFFRCGFSMMQELKQQRNFPSVVDAYLAIGEPEVAIQELLAREWPVVGNELELPLRLRELAERAYGPDHAAARFAEALNSVEIRNDPLHKTARVQLFGLWLPLPVGEIRPAEGTPPGSESLPDDPIHDYSVAELRTMLESEWQQQDIDEQVTDLIEMHAEYALEEDNET